MRCKYCSDGGYIQYDDEYDEYYCVVCDSVLEKGDIIFEYDD